MLRNYIVVALRNLARNRLYTGISIVALTVGLCAATLASVTVRNELAYEHFIPGYEHTYLAAAAAIPTGRPPLYTMETPSFVAALLQLNFAQIRAVTRIAAADVHLRHEQVEANERLYWADANAFDLLPLPVFAGNLKQALRRPDGIVLTRSIAQKYFGRDDPIGQSILVDKAHAMTVTAVIDDLPVNGTMLESGIFASGQGAYSALSKCDRDAPEIASKGGVVLCGQTYVRLAPQTHVDRLQRAIDALVVRAYPKFPGMTMTVRLIRIDRVHLFDGLYPGMQARVTVVGAVALLILVASCVVFVNLATARSVRRAAEVGIRKACGASRATLILQFLGESLIYVGLASCLALALSELFLPTVNAFLNSAGHLDLFHDATLIFVAAGAIVTVGILAGAYPAFVLSAFSPSVVLRGSLLGSSGALPRKALVILQFTVLIGLMLAATVIYRQCLYATHDALRVNTDQMLIVRSPCKPSLVTELRALPGVRGAYCSAESLLDRGTFSNARLIDGTPLAIDTIAVEFGVFDLYGIKPLAGVLPAEGPSETGPGQNASQVVINETAARRFGFNSPAAAIGNPLPLSDGTEQLAEFAHASLAAAAANQIVAVTPDFSVDAVAQEIRPTFYVRAPQYQLINVKLTGRDIPETLAAIDRISVATGSEKPLEHFFLNTYIQNLHVIIVREAQAFAVFSAIALVLACLGLLGLSAATADRRTKEIGIRKAMGAGTSDILRMLLWEFTTPILWASLIAWPLSALMLERWLEGFAYHVQLQPWVFFAASSLALAIALLTVGAQTLLVARARPVDALRYE
jgi:putative ABC transport system permease protein